MSEPRLSERLRAAPLPEEREAEDRSWRVVRAAFEARRPGPARRRPARLAIAVAIGLLILALGLSPAGAKVADLFEEIANVGTEKARPALGSLPAPGRLLVTSARGPWIVSEDGSKRLLGAYRDATWSAHGLFVAVARDRELTAVDPMGTVRWSLGSQHPVSDPAWATSGFRIAYLSGRSMRVVAGDGTGDRLLARDLAPIAAAWRPLSPPAEARIAKGFGTETLAFADAAGRVHVVDADSGRTFWVSAAGPVPRELLWSPDGGKLVAVMPSSLRVFDRGGALSQTVPLPAGARAGAAAFTPTGNRLALIRAEPTRSAAGRSEVELVRLGSEDAPERRLFSDPGRFTDLAWSPNGRWLLLAWRDADQWLFVRPSDEKVVAVSNISRQFDPGATGRPPFPGVSGWCCAP